MNLALHRIQLQLPQDGSPGLLCSAYLESGYILLGLIAL